MKKFLSIITCLLAVAALTSCGTKYVVTANYDVCYPDGTRTYDGSAVVTSSTAPDVACYSFSGTNYISVIKTDTEIGTYKTGSMSFVSASTVKKAEHITSSTAPIRLNYYNVERAKKKKQQYYSSTKRRSDDIYMSDILPSR